MIKFLILLLPLFAHASIESWQTPKGAKVLFTKSTALPMLDIRLTFDAASSREGNKFGLARLTNKLLGTRVHNKTQTQVVDALSSTGAQLSNASLKDMAIISLRTLTRDGILNPMVDLFAQLVGQPYFDPEILARFKKNTQQSLKARQDQPASLLKERFDKIIFTNHAYAHLSIGTSKSINNISIKDIKQYYQQFYVAKNLTIAIIGDISTVQAKDIAKRLSQHLNTGKKPPKIAKVKPITTAITQHIEFDASQSHLYLGKVGISRNHPDYYALYLANHIFGGSALNSVLGEVIREKNGLAYSVNSRLQPMAGNGYFAINLQTKNDQLKQATDLSLATLAKFIKSGITQTAINDAKDNIVGGFALRTASNSAQLSYLSLIGFYDLPLSYLPDFLENIKNLSLEQIQSAVKKFFHNPAWVNISIGKQL